MWYDFTFNKLRNVRTEQLASLAHRNVLISLSEFFSGKVPYRMDLHQNNDGQQRELYRCPNLNCAKFFKWKGNMIRHLRYECGRPPRFKCPHCDYCCKVKADVTKHITRIHKNSAIYVVDVSQRATDNKLKQIAANQNFF